MSTAYVALGSNLGQRDAAILHALSLLHALPQTRVTAHATLRETDPVDAPPGSGPFINTVAALDTTLAPDTLLTSLLDIEQRLGRDRGDLRLPRNGPRTIDLDLLLAGDHRVDTPTLTLPHPRMHLRRFVLEPLAEIAPDLIHPTLRKSIRQLLAELPGSIPASF